MRRVSSVLAVLSLVVLLPRGSNAADVAPVRLERLVPATTMAFVSIEEVGKIGDRFRATALGKMLDDPEMKGFLAPLREDLNAMLSAKAGDGRLPIPPLVLELLGKLAGLEGQGSVALVDLVEGRPTLAACLDFGGRLDDFVAFLTRIQDDPSGDGPAISTKTVGSTTVWMLGKPSRPIAFATTLGTAILLSTDETWLLKRASAGLAPVDSPLADAPLFRKVRSATGGEALALSVYGNAPAILAKVSPPPEAQRMISALGVDSIEAVGYGMAFVGDGILDTIVIEAPKSDGGILAMMPSKAISHAGLAWAPSTAFYYGEESLETSALLPKVRELFGRIDPDMAREIDETIAKVNETIGMDLQKDVLSGFGDGLTFWLGIPETGGLYPELALVFDVKDAAAFEKTVEKAVDALCGAANEHERVTASRRVLDWHGKRIHVVDVASVKRGKIVPFTPTICFTEGKMVVTLVPHAMKEILLRRESGGAGGGLGAQEDVKALLASAPPGHASFGYVDLQAILSLLYDTAVPVAQTIAKPNVLGGIPLRLDWAQLPPARLMRPYFRSLGGYMVNDGKSLKSSVHSPFGMMVPVVLVAATAGAIVSRTISSGMAEIQTFPDPVPMDDSMETQAAQASADTIRDAVVAFGQASGRLPESLSDLAAKNPRTDAAYLSDLPLDPWGFSFVYTILDSARGSFEVRTWGPDGRSATSDDVVASGSVR